MQIRHLITKSVVLNRNLVYIFLIIAILGILRRLVSLILETPLSGSDSTRYIVLLAAIIPVMLGWYAQPIAQKIGCYSLGCFIILEAVGGLIGFRNDLWFKLGIFFLLGVSVISFVVGLKMPQEKDAEHKGSSPL